MLLHRCLCRGLTVIITQASLLIDAAFQEPRELFHAESTLVWLRKSFFVSSQSLQARFLCCITGAAPEVDNIIPNPIQTARKPPIVSSCTSNQIEKLYCLVHLNLYNHEFPGPDL